MWHVLPAARRFHWRRGWKHHNSVNPTAKTATGNTHKNTRIAQHAHTPTRLFMKKKSANSASIPPRSKKQKKKNHKHLGPPKMASDSKYYLNQQEIPATTPRESKPRTPNQISPGTQTKSAISRKPIPRNKETGVKMNQSTRITKASTQQLCTSRAGAWSLSLSALTRHQRVMTDFLPKLTPRQHNAKQP